NVDFATGYNSLQDILTVQLGKEMIEELGLSSAEYRITSLAYSREIFRGERPQLFALAECGLSRPQLATRLESLPVARREFDSYEFVDFGSSAEGLNHEAAMNHALIAEYLSLG
ncbi:MAG: hypothetical protein JSU65_00445, partial [Candidatus Zixiibacteriota bacterium]